MCGFGSVWQTDSVDLYLLNPSCVRDWLICRCEVICEMLRAQELLVQVGMCESKRQTSLGYLY